MYLHTPALEVGSWWRVDTASGSDTATTVYAHDGTDAIPTSLGTSGSTVRGNSPDGTARFWSATATLYCKELTYQGVPTGTVVTSTGVTPAAPGPAAPVDIATISTAVAALPTTYAPIGGPTTAPGRFGIGHATDVRQPVSVLLNMNGPAVLAGNLTLDKVAVAQAITVTGDFTGDAGSSPSVLWGQNVFLVTGSTAGDGKGIATIVGGLIEANVGTPAGTTFPVVRGFEAQAALFGAAAGATVTQIESARVSAPVRKNGATGGTVGTAYSLIVDSPTIASGANFALYVNGGGVSRFTGRVDVTNTIDNDGSSDLSIFAGYAAADGGTLRLRKAGNNGNIDAIIATSGGLFTVNDGTSTVFSVSRAGAVAAVNATFTSNADGTSPLILDNTAGAFADLITARHNGTAVMKLDGGGNLKSMAGIFMRNAGDTSTIIGFNGGGLQFYQASLAQTTVGAAGAASALPATPTKYLKILDSAGTTLVIPCYAAS